MSQYGFPTDLSSLKEVAFSSEPEDRRASRLRSVAGKKGGNAVGAARRRCTDGRRRLTETVREHQDAHCTLHIAHYTYRLIWSSEDGEHVGLCAELPSLSWLAPKREEALAGIRQAVAETVADMQANGEPVPGPLAGKHHSG